MNLTVLQSAQIRGRKRATRLTAVRDERSEREQAQIKSIAEVLGIVPTGSNR